MLLGLLASVLAQGVEYENAVKFEYKCLVFPITYTSSAMLDNIVSVMTEICNQYGINGWEIVSTTPLAQSMLLMIFKRPVYAQPNLSIPSDVQDLYVN